MAKRRSDLSPSENTMRQIFLSFLLAAASLVTSAALAQDDVGSSQQAVCCGGECCLIGGTCFRRGDPNPANSCQMCDPSSSQSSFTAISGCGGTDAGPPASSGGGCSVSAVSTSAPFVILGLVGTALVMRRRRR